MNWDWKFAAEALPPIARGLGLTVALSAAAMALALGLGLVWALLRRTPWPAVRWPARILTEFIRSTPLLVQLFFAFYALPRYGISLPPLACGILTLGLHYSAYTAEVYRAGLESVPREQHEACLALNLPPAGAFVRIILPQAIRPVLPALGNYFIALFKDAPMLSAITVLGVLYRAKDIGSETFRYLEPMTLVGVLFLAVSLSAAQAVRLLERRLTINRQNA